MILSVFVRLFRNVCSLKLLANGTKNSRCSLFSLVQLNVDRTSVSGKHI